MYGFAYLQSVIQELKNTGFTTEIPEVCEYFHLPLEQLSF